MWNTGHIYVCIYIYVYIYVYIYMYMYIYIYRGRGIFNGSHGDCGLIHNFWESGP